MGWQKDIKALTLERDQLLKEGPRYPRRRCDSCGEPLGHVYIRTLSLSEYGQWVWNFYHPGVHCEK